MMATAPSESAVATTTAATGVPMFQPGDIIFEDAAYVSVLNDEERGKRCDFCFRCPDRSLLAGPLGACAKCKFVHYCSKECQRGDWPAHKTECKRILSLPENLREKLANAMVRLMARIVDRDVRGDNITVKSDVYKRCFDDLEPHVEELRQQPERMQRLQIIVEALKYFLRVPDPLLLLKYDDAFFTRVFGRIAVNSYGVTDELGSSDIGTAIYLDASRLDHSCKPNAVTSFHGTAAHIRALEPIPKAFLDLGPKKMLSRIRTTYSVVDLLQLASTKKRKEKLKKKYLFECDCQWCNEDDLSFLGRCPECEGLVQPGGENAFLPCEQCGYTLSGDEMTLIKQIVVESLIEHEKIARLMEKEEYKDCLDRCHALMLKQDQVFHQANRLSLKTIIKVFTCAYTVLPISLTEEDPVDIDRRLEHLIEMMANYGQLLTQTLAHPLLASLKTFFTEFYLATAASQQKMGLHSEAIDTLEDLYEAVCRGRGPQSSFATLVRAYKSECEAKRQAGEGSRDAGLEIITDAMREMSKVFSRQHPQWKRMQELQYELEMPDLLTGGGSGGRSVGGSSINNDNNTSSLDVSDDSSVSTNGDDPPLALINQEGGEEGTSDLTKPPAAQSSVPLRKILEGIPSKLSEAEISSSDDLLDEKPTGSLLSSQSQQKRKGGKKGGGAKLLTIPGGGTAGSVVVNLRSPARNEECDSVTSEGSEVRVSLYEAEKNKLRNKKKRRKERKQSEELLQLQKADDKKSEEVDGVVADAASVEPIIAAEEVNAVEAAVEIKEENMETKDIANTDPKEEALLESETPSKEQKMEEEKVDIENKDLPVAVSPSTKSQIDQKKPSPPSTPSTKTSTFTSYTPSPKSTITTPKTTTPPKTFTPNNNKTSKTDPSAKSTPPPPPPRPKEKPVVPIKSISAKPAAMSWARIVAKAPKTEPPPAPSTPPTTTATPTATPVTTTPTPVLTSPTPDTKTNQSETTTPDSSTASTVQASTDASQSEASFSNADDKASYEKGDGKRFETPKEENKETEKPTTKTTTSTETEQPKAAATTITATTEKKSKPRAKSRGRSKRAKSQAKAASASAQETDSPSNTLSATPVAKVSPPATVIATPEEKAAEKDNDAAATTSITPKSTTPTQTKEEMEARMTSLLVKKSDDDDSNMSDKEKAGVAWRILQFCLASRIQKVKVTQDTHILQEPPGPEKARTLQEQFVSKLAADSGEAPVEESQDLEMEGDNVDAAAAVEGSIVTEQNAETSCARPQLVDDKQTKTEEQELTPQSAENKKPKSRNASKSASQSRSRTPSVSLDKPPNGGKNNKKSKSGGKNNKKADEDEDLDALIAEAKKMDAERALEPGVTTPSRRSTSRSSSKAKEIPPAAAAITTEVAASAEATAEATVIQLETIKKERSDYVEVKSNYDNMFEEFETDILLSMEEMQKMGQTSGRMEDRLNAIQSKSSNQSHRFRAAKESYKALGKDLEDRLKKMAKKKKEEEEKEEERQEAGNTNEADSSPSFPENEMQNALMSSLEGTKTDDENKSSPPPIYSPIEDDAELTDKGYTLTDDGVSDDLDVFGGIKRKTEMAEDEKVMSASMFVTSASREDDTEDVMTSSAVSWGDLLEGDEAPKGEFVAKVEEVVTAPSSVLVPPEAACSRQILTAGVSEDSGLSDSKTSDPYDPYRGKKKRKQRPRVKSMIEI